MKKFIRQSGLVLVLSLLFIAIFALGNLYSRYMTGQIAVHAQAELNEIYTGIFGSGSSVAPLEAEDVEKTYELSGGRPDYSPKLVSAYVVCDGETAIGVVYVVESIGESEGLVIAYAIDFESDSVIGATLLAHEESQASLTALTETFYAQFDDKTLDDIALAIEPAAGASLTSEGFNIGLLYAREQYMADYDFEISQDQFGLQFLTMFPGSTAAESFTASVVAKTYILAENRGDFSPTIDSAWKIFSGATEVGVVYVVNTYGKYDLKLAFGFDLSDHSTTGVVVLVQNETPFYYGKLTPAFFEQFAAGSLTEIGFGVDGIAGATLSSKGYEIGWQYAREVYAVDYDFTIPTVQATLVEVRYNFDPTTFVASPFIADITYGEGNTAASVLLSSTFDYVGLVGGGADLETDLQSAVKSMASQAGTVSSKAYLFSYDAGTRIVLIRAKGYNSNTHIQVAVTLNATLDGVESYLVSSSESYDDEINVEYGDYTGGPVPAVENNFLGQCQTNATILPFDAVAGASAGTGPAMHALITLLDAFINDLNGGN